MKKLKAPASGWTVFHITFDLFFLQPIVNLGINPAYGFAPKGNRPGKCSCVGVLVYSRSRQPGFFHYVSQSQYSHDITPLAHSIYGVARAGERDFEEPGREDFGRSVERFPTKGIVERHLKR